MATKLIKKKVLYLNVGNRKYKYIETLLEILPKKRPENSVIIDLTDTDDENSAIKSNTPKSPSLTSETDYENPNTPGIDPNYSPTYFPNSPSYIE